MCLELGSHEVMIVWHYPRAVHVVQNDSSVLVLLLDAFHKLEES